MSIAWEVSEVWTSHQLWTQPWHEKIGDKRQFNNYLINVVKKESWSTFICELRGAKPLSLQVPTWRGAIQDMLQWLSWPHGCCSCGRTDMFDKLLVTTLVKMAHVLDTYHGQYLRFRPLTRARMSMCRVCLCVFHVGVARNLRRNSCMYVLGVYPFSSWRDRRRRK